MVKVNNEVVKPNEFSQLYACVQCDCVQAKFSMHYVASMYVNTNSLKMLGAIK